MSSLDLVNQISTNDALGASATFDAMMLKDINAKIASVKMSLAKSLFGDGSAENTEAPTEDDTVADDEEEIEIEVDLDDQEIEDIINTLSKED